MQAPNKPVRLGGQKGVVIVARVMWEYTKVCRETITSSTTETTWTLTVDEINANYGRKGWELVNVAKQGGYETWFFKRPIE